MRREIRWRVLWPSGGGRWDRAGHDSGRHHPTLVHHTPSSTSSHSSRPRRHLSAHFTKRQQPTHVTNVSGLSSHQCRQRGKGGCGVSFRFVSPTAEFICRGFWVCINGAGTEYGLEKQTDAIDTFPPGTVQLYPPQHCYAQWEQTHTDAEHLIQTAWISLKTGPSL